jgi:hypothetical protein
MTQAFNLSQFANTLNTSGQTDVSVSSTGTLPIANGGTGSTSTTYCSLTTNVSGTLPVARGGTGATTLTGLVLGNGTSAFTTVTAPSGNVVGTTDTQTLTNKRFTPRVTSITGAAGGTITPTGDTADQYNINALGAAATFAIPSGTPTDGQKLSIRIKDNGTARALTWTTSSGGYRIIGTILPTTTTASKTIYVGCVYNSNDTFWDVVAVATQA